MFFLGEGDKIGPDKVKGVSASIGWALTKPNTPVSGNKSATLVRARDRALRNARVSAADAGTSAELANSDPALGDRCY